MARMIDMSETTAIISDYFDAICDTEDTFDEAVLLKLLNNKAVEAAPVRKGHWIPHKFPGLSLPEDGYDCSVCDEWYTKTALRYCPNCGADMREEWFA